MSNSGGISAGGSSPASAASTLTVVSGIAQQDVTEVFSTVYANINGGTLGTVTASIGPTSAASAATVANTDIATGNITVVFNLPAGWWFKVTVGGSATIGTVQQVTS